MPYAIDEDKINSDSMKVMDINHPPVKNIPHEKFPKMVFLHPKDKTKEHLTKIVQNEKELDSAVKQGWKLKPHIAQEPEFSEALGADYEIAK